MPGGSCRACPATHPTPPDAPHPARAALSLPSPRQRLEEEHRGQMGTHAALWLQGQIDRAADATGVVAALAAYRALSDRMRVAGVGVAAGLSSVRGPPRSAVERGATLAGLACDQAALNDAFDQVREDLDGAVDVLCHQRARRPTRWAALSLHLWSYSCATEVDLGGVGLDCDALLAVGQHLAGCRYLMVLRLSHNRLDDRLASILPVLFREYTSLSRVTFDNNPLGDAARLELDAAAAAASLRLRPTALDELVLQHAALFEIEAATHVQAALHGGRGTRPRPSGEIVGALPSVVDALARVVELRLEHIAWRPADLWETLGSLAGRARNLRFLRLSVEPSDLLDVPRPAAHSGRADDAEGEGMPSLISYGEAARLTLSAESRTLLTALGRLGQLISLHLLRLPLQASSLHLVDQMLDSMPNLLELQLVVDASGQDVEADAAGLRLAGALLARIRARDPARPALGLPEGGLVAAAIADLTRVRHRAVGLAEQQVEVLAGRAGGAGAWRVAPPPPDP